MTKKDILKGVKQDNPEQSKRFTEAAREHEDDDSEKAFEKIIENVAPKTGVTPKAG